MSKNNITSFFQEKSKKIAKIIIEKYDESDLDTDSLIIEKDIWESCKNYVSIFIFENNYLLDDENKIHLQNVTSSSFDISDRKVNKMDNKELISHVLKIYVFDELSEIYDFIII